LEKSDRIRELYALYTESKATEAELAEFFALSGEPANEGIFRELFTDTWEELQNADPRNRQVRPIRRIQRWVRTTAAAAIIMVLGAGIYFISKSKPATEPEIAKAIKTDIAPGGNKAMLTLGNGSKIILDSAVNGTLAQQGNTKIVKMDNGKLAYNGSTEKPSDIAYNTLSTPRGGQYQLMLPDGTKVWLNAASSITYPTAFNSNKRTVSITGEVYFEVKHDSKKPFSVKVADFEVQDIGTHFDINAYSDETEIKTTLLEGKINVFASNKNHLLSPGQQATIANNKVTILSDVDLQRVVAWQEGRFEFNETQLPVIFRQISRWYDVDIKMEGPVTIETFGGGISRNLPLSDILKLLEANGLQFRLENKTLFVKTKTQQ
jgi:transmembrane sensor